jgi:signal transduction histidine kinase
MKIRSKISLTFVMLLIFGVTAVSSYAIMFIRNYLLNEGQETIVEHANWLSYSLEDVRNIDELAERIAILQEMSGYDIRVYDENGVELTSVTPSEFLSEEQVSINEEILTRLTSDGVVLINDHENKAIYVFQADESRDGEARFFRVAQLKDKLYEPITTIRWIIYTGMFISIGLILLVSNIFARYLSKPILELKDAAQQIAEGKRNSVKISDRSDEFGELSSSINSMARRLSEDNERLSQINEKQSQFFADITHEIRNPLHTIMGSMELLQTSEAIDEKQRRYIDNARNQAERINSLFKDLLTLQRYDSDENFIQQQWFDLQRITTRIEDLYFEEAQKKSILLNIQKTPCRVLADAAKIEQVLDNLISNALKYTLDGEVGLMYEVLEKKVTISVYDTGTGIAEEHVPRLFDRFYRTDKARSRDQGGTGLGLAVVKSILDAHGVEVNVKSALGKGTTFSFDLNSSGAK